MTIAMLSAVTLFFDSLRGKRAVSTTESSGAACFNHFCSTLVGNRCPRTHSVKGSNIMFNNHMNNNNFVTCVAETFLSTVITFWVLHSGLNKGFPKSSYSLFNIPLSTNQIIFRPLCFFMMSEIKKQI